MENKCNVCHDMNYKFANQSSSPADTCLQSPRSSCFGIPEAEDPDPFGVIALEKAGFEIRESGTGSRPSSYQFEYHPSPNSPIFTRFNRRSIDTIASRSNRGSCISTKTRASIERATQTVEACTQTDYPSSPNTSPSYYSDYKQTIEEEQEEIDYATPAPNQQLNSSNCLEDDKINPIETPRSASCADPSNEPSHVTRTTSEALREVKNNCDLTRNEAKTLNEVDVDPSESEDDEEPVILEASAQATRIRSTINVRGGLVNIPKRGPPPPLPARSASRGTIDANTLESLLKQYEAAELHKISTSRLARKSVNSPRIVIPASHAALPNMRETLDEKCFLNMGFHNSVNRVCSEIER